jgi:hypothetical protein
MGDDDFANQTKGDAAFLTRLDLMQFQSTLVQQADPADPNAPKAGQFIFGQDKNLGTSLVVVAACREQNGKVVPLYRSHALLLVDQEVEAESFDPNSEVYKQIHAESKSKQKVEGRAAMTGVDMLFWIPAAQDFGVFYFKKTMKKEADAFYRLGQAGTVAVMRSHLIVTAYRWYVPKGDPYVPTEKQTPIADLARPSKELTAKAIELFIAPLVATTPVEETGGEARAR